MARSPSRRDLYLQVDGTTDPLRTALKAGKSILAEFGTSAENQLQRIEDAFQKLGGSNPAQAAKQLEQAYTRSFDAIREQAEKAIATPLTKAGAINIDAGAAREAATAATSQAAALREIAVAAERAAAATSGDSAAARVYALAAAAAAQGAEEQAAALRTQARVLEQVQGELNATGATAAVTGKRVTQMSGQAKAGLQQLTFNLNDVATGFAAGTPPQIIFAQQLGQVTQAVQLMTSESTGLLRVLGNPWVQVAGAAAVALVPLVLKLVESNNELEKATKKLGDDARQTDIARQAHEAFAKTLDGQLEIQRKVNEELERGLKSQRQLTQQRLLDAEAQESSGKRELASALLNLDRAQKSAARLRTGNQAGPGGGAAVASAIGAADQRVKAAEERVRKARELIAGGQEGARAARVSLAVDDAAAESDALTGIKRKYDDLRDAARARAQASDEYAASLKGQLVIWDKAEKKEIEAEQRRQAAARSSAKDNREYGRTLTSSEAATIARDAGFKVNSADRSTTRQQQLYDDWVAAGRPSDNPVAKPGTSAHEKGKALDIQIEPGVTVKAIREAFEKEGVRLTKIFKERGHYHVEFATEKKADPARVADKEANRRASFGTELAQAQDRYLRAQQSLAEGTEDQADVAFQQLRAETVNRETAYQRQLAAGKLTNAEFDQLSALNQGAYEAEKTAIARAKQQRLLDQQFELDRQALQDRLQTLRVQEQLATTLSERRSIAQRILELEREEARKAAQRKIDSNDPATRAQGKREIDSINARSPIEQAALDRQYASPLQRYRQELLDTTADMNSALEQVAVEGFGRLEDAEARQITKLLGLKGEFGDLVGSVLSDFARIGIKMLELQAIDWLGLGGKKDFASGVGGGDVLNLAGALGAQKGGGLIKSIGKIFGFADGGQVDAAGRITGPGSPTSDSILALLNGQDPIALSTGESIVNAAATRRYWPLIDAMNRGVLPGFATGGLVAPAGYIPRIPDINAVAPQSLARPMPAGAVQVEARVRVDASPLLDARMEEVSVRTIGAAAEPIMAGAEKRTLRRANRPVLPGGYG